MRKHGARRATIAAAVADAERGYLRQCLYRSRLDRWIEAPARSRSAAAAGARTTDDRRGLSPTAQRLGGRRRPQRGGDDRRLRSLAAGAALPAPRGSSCSSWTTAPATGPSRRWSDTRIGSPSCTSAAGRGGRSQRGARGRRRRGHRLHRRRLRRRPGLAAPARSRSRGSGVGIAGGDDPRPSRRRTTSSASARQIHDHRRAIEDLRPPYAITMSWASRREVLDELGGFDERFPRCQDVDLSYRVVQAGYRLAFVPEAVVYHRNEPTLPGLFREGFVHGFHGVRARKRHAEFLRRFGHGRVDAPRLRPDRIASSRLGPRTGQPPCPLRRRLQLGQEDRQAARLAAVRPPRPVSAHGLESSR